MKHSEDCFITIASNNHDETDECTCGANPMNKRLEGAEFNLTLHEDSNGKLMVKNGLETFCTIAFTQATKEHHERAQLIADAVNSHASNKKLIGELVKELRTHVAPSFSPALTLAKEAGYHA